MNDAVKRATGKTAGQVIQQRVLLEAKRLLSLTDMGIAEVAYQLGYDDLAYFCRFFKRHTQTTPGDFRKRHARPVDAGAA
ncbi:helix-turn-helix domain-containing protein [Pigmentiphaga litoralis]|uniref:helix-turn-helix domain-containing protein n=1 Tax=Pigmentiphaga litoralis TaxID=516702 RepID=UPI003B42AE37